MVERLVRAPLYPTGSRVMLALIGVSILWRVVSVWSEVPFLYGELSAAPLPPRSVHALHIIWSLAAFGLISARYTRACSLIAIVAYSIDAFAGLQDAGDYLARIVLVYTLLLDQDLIRGRTKGELNVFLHNLGALGILVQLCVVYVNTSLWKLQGADNFWLEGTMLYYATHLQNHGMAWAQELFEVPFVVYTATYAALLYQLSFLPLLFTRWHGVSVIVGVGFHLGIVLVLGLVPFGLVMTGLVLFTVRESTWQRLRSLMNRTKLYYFRQVQVDE